MEQVNIYEAKAQLSRLVERAAAGEEIVIARRGKPVAKLVPLESLPTKRQFGRLKGLISIPDDFDAPLPSRASTARTTRVSYARRRARASIASGSAGSRTASPAARPAATSSLSAVTRMIDGSRVNASRATARCMESSARKRN